MSTEASLMASPKKATQKNREKNKENENEKKSSSLTLNPPKVTTNAAKPQKPERKQTQMEKGGKKKIK